MIRKIISLVCLSLFVTVSAQAQDEYQQWLNQYKKEYQEFKDARDKEFANLLKQAWQFVRVEEPVKAYEEPKVVKPPVAEPAPPDKVKTAPPEPIKVLPPEPEPEPQPIVAPPIKEKEPEPKKEEPETKPEPQFEPPKPAPTPKPAPEPVKEELPKTTVAYFGMRSQFTIDPKIKSAKLESFDPKGLAAYWEQLGKTGYEPLVEEFQKNKEQEELNDWATGYMMESVAASVYPGKASHQIVFMWFFLNKLGYAAKVGYNKEGVYLMLPTENRLYNTKYFKIDGQRYYVVRFVERKVDCGALYTYKGNYPQSTKKINFELATYPKIPENVVERVLKFEYEGQAHTIPVSYNKSIVDFFDQYPQTDLPIYFKAPVSNAATISMVRGLKPIIQGKSEWDAVNIILRFVQTAFEYKTDDDQFGYEKYFFVEETISYPYSDCEDRSIMFAYLVRALTGNDVVGLKYPGHLATAVAFNDQVGGDQLNYKGKTYTVCDPTYKNADIGMSMPNFKGKAPQVVVIN